MKRVLIASWVPSYNRQGADLCGAINGAGFFARLWQVGWGGFAGGRLSRLRRALEKAKFLCVAITGRFDVVVLVGRPMLSLAGVCKRMLRMKVVYYSLEYSKLSGGESRLLASFVDRIIDVEENRIRQFMEDNALKVPGLVVNNMPHLHDKPMGGKLKDYLLKKFGIASNVKIVVYAGSYQRYLRLEKIIEAATRMKGECVFVLMMYANLKGLNLPDNVKVIPPVSGDDFYSWLADADCALLPYETADDFNVKNCSPQKLFDCYLAGVPYVASNRPIIMKTLEAGPLVGVLCSFDDVEQIMSGVRTLLCRDRNWVRKAMRHLHETRFNYDLVEKDVLQFCYLGA